MATFVSMEEQAAVSEVKRCGGSFCFKTKGDRDLTDDDLLLKNLKSLWQVIVFKPTDLHLTSTPACQKLFTVYASAFSQLLCVESLKKLYLTYLFIWSFLFHLLQIALEEKRNLINIVTCTGLLWKHRLADMLINISWDF